MIKFGLYILSLFAVSGLFGAGFYERLPIDYENGATDNEIEELQKKIDGGLVLAYDEKHGYLKAILKELKIPISTQVLVFSKTSFHRKLISSENPRALYFNRNSYIGWVDGAEVLEVGVADKNLGAVFYTFPQKKVEKPKFNRDNSCLSCHASGRTEDEPGFFIRSVYPDKLGEPIGRAGESRVEHSTPIEERWGGWYVTHNGAKPLHRGNGVAEKDGPFEIFPKPANKLKDLAQFFDSEKYLAQTSDIQSLMLLEHQVKMHNILTATKFRTLHALHSEKVINEVLHESGRREQTERILQNAATEILDYLLFESEVELNEGEISGDAAFQRDFTDFFAPKEPGGKALSELSFESKMTKYPCSWLIYSDSFSGLPKELKEIVINQLIKILTDENLPDKYIHLRKTRKDIHQILLATHADYRAGLSSPKK